MIAQQAAELDRVLSALPQASRQRLLTMGWGTTTRLRDPERALRRALCGPMSVSLADLELSPERWHGRYVSTTGVLTWLPHPRGEANLGRLWLDPLLPFLSGRAAFPGLRSRTVSARVRIAGLVAADPSVRAAYRSQNQKPGGYGPGGLFIAKLVVVSCLPLGER